MNTPENIDLERQVYFWRKCCEEKDKEIVHIRSELHFAKKKYEKGVAREASKKLSDSPPLNRNAKKRKSISLDLNGNLGVDDCSSYDVEIKRLKHEHLINKIKMDLVRRLLAMDDLDGIGLLSRSDESKKPQYPENIGHKLESYKKQVEKLEIENAKYKERVEDLEKSLKEVLVHVLGQSQDNGRSDAVAIEGSNGVSTDDLESVVDEIESSPSKLIPNGGIATS